MPLHGEWRLAAAAVNTASAAAWALLLVSYLARNRVASCARIHDTLLSWAPAIVVILTLSSAASRELSWRFFVGAALNAGLLLVVRLDLFHDDDDDDDDDDGDDPDDGDNPDDDDLPTGDGRSLADDVETWLREQRSVSAA